MKKKWTRREFLKSAAIAAGSLMATDALSLDVLLPVHDPLGAYPYRGWETFYRNLWTYDYFGRVAHSVNCTGSCTWKAYVKNGIAFKEEQFADYPEINPHIPVYNPRGCQKGANHKEYVYGPQRTKYPLKRVPGTPRGGGQWQRISWDQALSEIAAGIVSAINTPWTDKNGNVHQYSPDTVNFYAAIPAKHQITVAGGFRLSNLIGSTVMSFYDWYCDLPPGQPQVWGVQTDACESADWYNSKLIMLMGANLPETRIPDAHYYTEARARGTKIVAVFPDYNAACIHADTFVPLKPGTDGALCCGMTKWIIDHNMHDVPYMKQFTDMAFLVRTGPKDPLKGKFLRNSDALNPDGSPVDPVKFNQYYVWDSNTNKAVVVPGTLNNGGSLNLGAINPKLDGVFVAMTPSGPVQVTTVFALLKQKLAPFTVAKTAEICGLSTSLVAQLAQDFASIKPARIIEGAGTNHWFHNDLTNRAQIMLLAVTGNVGKPGTGFDHYVGQEKIWPEAAWFQLSYPYGRPRQRFQNTTLWTYVHGNAVSDVDYKYPRPISSYIKESVDKGWMPLWPKETLDVGRTPKVMFIWGANYINQAKGYNDLVNTLLPKLDMIIDVNLRMDTSATMADYVLPAASMFEKWDLNSTDLHTFMIPFTPVIDLQYECRTDWQIWRSIAQALASTGFSYLDTDAVGPGGPILRNFADMPAQFDTMNVSGMNIADDKNAATFILNTATETQGFTLDVNTPSGLPRFTSEAELNAMPDSSIIKHPKRFPATSEAWTSEILPGEAYYGLQRMYDLKQPLGTQAGRQQFYIDHDWYLKEFKEELPTYKGTVDADPYPLRWSTPHGRWSIHSTWRDAKFQLRLQRGRTVCYINPAEAAARGIVDNDLVEVYNAHGAVQVHVDLSSRVPMGQAVMYHGWERYQHNTGWQAPTHVRINPSQLVGKYGQMAFRLNYWGPTGNQKDTRVEIRKV